MVEPSLDNLVDLVDSKYTLVVLTAKRAREIVDLGEKESIIFAGKKTSKPVTIALQEIFHKKISYERIQTSQK